jgi:N-acetylglucosaminyltransferase
MDILHIWQILPVTLILGVFVGGLLLRLTTRAARPKKDYSYEPRVSVLLPVYNEGAHVLETIDSILSADWPRDKLEIIAIDDRSKDDSYAYMQRAERTYGRDRIRVGQNEVNSGKHVTLTRALKQSTGDIVICIDSDCIFKKDVIRELTACFCDPEVGAVGGHIGVSNTNDNACTMIQALVYFMSFQVGKMLQNARATLFCISGCLFAVRREIFEDVEEDLRNRNWFGMKVRDGEDRYMTHTILLAGWKTLINPKAICWTAVPTTLSQLFMQQLRWRRSGLRDVFWTARRLPMHLRTLGIRAVAAAMLPEIFTIMWSLYILTAIPAYGVGFMLNAVLTAFITFSPVFIVAALLHNIFVEKLVPGSQKIASPLLAGLAGAWFFMDSLVITVLALFTFDVGEWGTRTGSASASQAPANAPEPVASLALQTPAKPAEGAMATNEDDFAVPTGLRQVG